ncbi:hypothetical protein F7725_027486 [Dissostichus mawsoni]|uniref:Uncharacterized protein n=1 Tax=Dissostichus mawsoni TaxID=36200 RepID=A0A7J5XF56_DISMA|nr:hypothetical protein F7725_027486 [Dissostichus mawsoni]
MKYSNIEDLFQAQYPRTDTGKDFPHGVGAITKAQLAAKLKQIRMKYRHAVDTKRRSGQGRVCTCFLSCVKRSGVARLLRTPLARAWRRGTWKSRLPDQVHPRVWSVPTIRHSQSRANPAEAKLNSHRSDRLKRKLPADHAVQEDIKIKKRMLELMEQTSIRNADSIQQMNASIVNITSTIQDGFSLMRELIQAHPHSSSSGYGQFQEHSPPFMHRRPHLATLAYTPTRLSSNQSRGKLRGQQLYGTGEGHKTQKAERGSGGTW